MFIFIETLCSESKFFKYCLYVLPLVVIFVSKKLFSKLSKQLYDVQPRNETRYQMEDIDDDPIEKDSHYEPASYDPIPYLPDVDHVPYSGWSKWLDKSGSQFYDLAKNRRSVRDFNTEKPVDFAVIERCILSAGTAPSGVGTQPWTYCVIGDAAVKQQIRDVIEAEEYLNYTQRMSPQWITDLRPLKTNHVKPYLTEAPYLIVVFKQIYGFRPDGTRMEHYYNELSVSVSVGILVSALVCAGLAFTVTKPANVGSALKKVLKRPDNEKFMYVVPVGYSTDDCKVASILTKSLDNIMVKY